MRWIVDISELIRTMYEEEYLTFYEIAVALGLSEDYVHQLYKKSNREYI